MPTSCPPDPQWPRAPGGTREQQGGASGLPGAGCNLRVLSPPWGPCPCTVQGFQGGATLLQGGGWGLWPSFVHSGGAWNPVNSGSLLQSGLKWRPPTVYAPLLCSRPRDTVRAPPGWAPSGCRSCLLIFPRAFKSCFVPVTQEAHRGEETAPDTRRWQPQEVGVPRGLVLMWADPWGASR